MFENMRYKSREKLILQNILLSLRLLAHVGFFRQNFLITFRSLFVYGKEQES